MKTPSDEDVPVELARNVVVAKKLPNLPPGYSISEGKLAYNEEWDKIAEVQSDSEVEDSDLLLMVLYIILLMMVETPLPAGNSFFLKNRVRSPVFPV